MGKKGMLLVGHGSTMPYNQDLVEKTAAIIKAGNTDFIVKCGFMNMNKPTIKESLNAFRHEPIDALVVVPYYGGAEVVLVILYRLEALLAQPDLLVYFAGLEIVLP